MTAGAASSKPAMPGEGTIDTVYAGLVATVAVTRA
jgi:hypothetical protein